MSGMAKIAAALLRLHAAAVQDRDVSRGHCRCAQERVHRLRLLRASRCVRCRSPRPARRPAPHFAKSMLVQAPRPSCRATTSSRAPGFALLQRLADAQDRREPAAARGGELRRHLRVGLAVELAPLRMADDRVAAAELREHRRRHFAGVRALRVLADVLRAPGDRGCRAAASQPARGTDRADTPRTSTVLLRSSCPASASSKRAVGRPAAVHLPVAGDQPAALPHDQGTSHPKGSASDSLTR